MTEEKALEAFKNLYNDIDMDDDKEKIIDALNQVPEKYLVPVEEIAEALKIMNNRMKEFLDSGRKLSEKDWERIFNNL